MMESVMSGNGLPATGREAPLAGSGLPIAGNPLPAAAGEESYTIEVVAQLLKMSARTLRYWIDKDRVSTIESPTGRRISAAELERLRPIAAAHIAQHAGRRAQLPANDCRQPVEPYRLPAEDLGPDLNSCRLPAEDCRQPVEDCQQKLEYGFRIEQLEIKLEGAQTAARLHAQRRREETERFLAERREFQSRHESELAHEQAQVEREREERAKQEGQISFLQEQLQASRQAEHELRILMAQQTQALQRTAQSLEALEARTALPPLPRKKLKWWPFGQQR